MNVLFAVKVEGVKVNVVTVMTLVSNLLTVCLGVFIFIVVARVYSLYRSLGFSRTIITPFLLVGFMFTLCGVTQLLEVFVGELGFLIHSLVMLISAVYLLCGLKNYHNMLMKAEENNQS